MTRPTSLISQEFKEVTQVVLEDRIQGTLAASLSLVEIETSRIIELLA